MERSEIIEIPFGAFDSELKGWEYTIPEGMEAEIKDGKIIVREKESEDERIRKWIKKELESKYVVDNIVNNVMADKALAWLEKQGENVYNEELSKLLHEVICCFINNPNIPYSKREEVSKKIIPYVEKIENQGSQNLANSTKTCKVEQKFKAGNWYLCVNDFYFYGKGVRFDKGQAYYCGLNGCLQEFDSGAHIDIDEGLYDYFNLWTIQDAKDGDVLANKYGSVFIYAGFEDDKRVTVDDYCYITANHHEFCIEDHKTGSWYYVTELNPATKEQRDLLFQKMKDAGYEWDAEKKELRKIEQKPIDKTKFYDSMDDLIADALIGEIEGSELDDRCKYNRIHWIKSHRQHAAWSEEDEDYLTDVKPAIHDYYDDDYAEELYDWLNSFKERYTWKPSDEQMIALKGIASYNWNNTLESLYNDLKKLKG